MPYSSSFALAIVLVLAGACLASRAEAIVLSEAIVLAEAIVPAELALADLLALMPIMPMLRPLSSMLSF